MITVPYETIIQKIKEKTSLTDEQIETKIKAKMDQLSGLISKEGAAHIIANEEGVTLMEKTAGKVKIKDILPGMRSVEILAKVFAVYEVREFDTNGRQGKVGSFLVGDESGTTRIVAWGDQTSLLSTLKSGDIIKITDAYSKENRDRTELHLNERSKIEINPEGETVNVEARAQSERPPVTRKTIKELAENDQNVELLGTIVQVFDPRFFERQGKQSYVLNVILDDGSDNIRVVFFGDQAIKLLGIDDAQMQTYKEAPAGFEAIKNDMLGQVIKLSGRVTKNDMFERLEIIANQIDPNPDPEAELKNMGSQ